MLGWAAMAEDFTITVTGADGTILWENGDAEIADLNEPLPDGENIAAPEEAAGDTILWNETGEEENAGETSESTGEISTGETSTEGKTTGEETPGEAPTAPEETSPVGDGAAREAFIEDIIALAQTKYKEAKGKAQRAQYSGDIYVCKNFTVYLFRQNCDKYRMAAYPDVPLVIPDNKPKSECTDYVYGVEWKDVPASEGNPFEVAAAFRYDSSLSKAENQKLARAFLQQVRRGDYFQMAANYYYGIGAHSLIFIADYDPETDTVRWCDSNMKGEKRGNDRYGYVQFDAVKDIDWFVDAFCRKKYGATLYRLREDIIFAP